MKKITTFLLACLLAAGMCSCAKKKESPDGSDTTVTQQQEDTTAGGLIITPPEQKNEVTVKLNADTANVRFLGGREEYTSTTYTCNNPGSGFELKINSEGGDVKVRTECSDPCQFRVYVDGAAWKGEDGSEYYSVNGVKNLVIPGVSAGEHTIRVIRVSDSSVATAAFYGVTFNGAQMELTNPENVPFIEFIGDGITVGAALNGESNEVTLSYAYLVANAMNADYAITGFSGQGLTTGNSPISSAYGSKGNYSRPASIVVINVGAEDFAVEGSTPDAAKFQSDYKAFLKVVRAKNTASGSLCKIVCVATAAGEEYRAAIAQACEELGGAAAGYYCQALTASAAATPTAAEHAAYATELTTFINSIKDAAIEEMNLIEENAGYGEEVDFDSADW